MKRGIESIVGQGSPDFDVVELEKKWDIDIVSEFKCPVVIRDCQNFLTFNESFGPKEASKVFAVTFLSVST